MTLEQIKNRQEQLNNHLSQVLNGIRDTVDFIVEEIDEKTVGKDMTYPDNGLLRQIEYEQNKTEDYIDRLHEVSYRLSLNIFKPADLG
jgi:hypothetical protein